MTMKLEDKTLAQHASAANAIAVDAMRLANWRKRLAKNLSKPLGKLGSIFTFDADLLVPPKRGEDKPLVLVYIGSEDLTQDKIIVKINKALGVFLNPSEPLPPTIEVKLGTVELLLSFNGIPVAKAA
jgi:hypothetical protein